MQGEWFGLMKRAIELSCIAIILLTLAGCVYIPASGHQVLQGKRIEDQETPFIKAGVTSRTEVIQKLGEPSFEMAKPHIIGYSWEEVEGYMPWLVGGGYSVIGGVVTLPAPHNFFVAFDREDRASVWGVYGVYESWSVRPIQDYARSWAQHEGLAVTGPGAIFMARDVPPGQAMAYIYRPGGFTDAPLVEAAAVLVDEKLEAELKKGTYTAVSLTAGTHTISVNPAPHYGGFLRPDERPIRSVSLDTAPNMKYFVSFRIQWGWGSLDPALTIQSEQEAMPILEKMSPAK
jgi:hypothetical protein